MQIKITPISLKDVLEYDKVRYNSNNHGNMPCDYNKVLEKTYFSKFKHLKKYKSFDLPIELWMNEANKISIITNQFPNLYKEELEEYCIKYRNLDANFDKPYFIRTENVSLKYGCYGNKLCNNIKMLIESIITCPNRHNPLSRVQGNKVMKIYLIDPVEINPDLEFRVFIYNNKVTAISQQHIYKKNEILCNKDGISEINRICGILIEYVYSCIIPNIIDSIGINNYTIDLAIIKNEVYFIELNSFGAEYAAGSALFHWIIDKDILYNSINRNVVEFRYTS